MSNPKEPIFLDDEDELSSDVPVFYQALGVSDKVRERLNKIRLKREDKEQPKN